jgi:hypothetical protein
MLKNYFFSVSRKPAMYWLVLLVIGIANVSVVNAALKFESGQVALADTAVGFTPS